MNKAIYVVNNYNTDKFKNFEIPAFNAGETQSLTEPVSEAQTKNEVGLQKQPIIGIVLVLIVIIIFLAIKKLKENIIYKIQNAVYENNTSTDEDVNEENKQEEVISNSEKKLKKGKSYATPRNLQQCIMLFLENTKNK